MCSSIKSEQGAMERSGGYATASKPCDADSSQNVRISTIVVMTTSTPVRIQANKKLKSKIRPAWRCAWVCQALGRGSLQRYTDTLIHCKHAHVHSDLAVKSYSKICQACPSQQHSRRSADQSWAMPHLCESVVLRSVTQIVLDLPWIS